MTSMSSECPTCGKPILQCVCFSVHRTQQGVNEFKLTAEVEQRMFDFTRLEVSDRFMCERFLGSLDRKPDLVIDHPEHGPYLWRWHLVPRNEQGNVYFHIITGDDAERFHHDHPWDNMSTMLSGVLRETILLDPSTKETEERYLYRGQSVARPANMAHRLELVKTDRPYAITLFSTGRTCRDWGFWIDGKWYSHKRCTTAPNEHKQTFFRDPREHEVQA